MSTNGQVDPAWATYNAARASLRDLEKIDRSFFEVLDHEAIESLIDVRGARRF